MENATHYFDLVDDYLDNNLPQKEVKQFEQQLSDNPTLKSEYDSQKQLIEGIQVVRRLSLKSRLDAIVIQPVAPFWTMGIKMAVGLGIAVVLGYTSYVSNSVSEKSNTAQSTLLTIAKKTITPELTAVDKSKETETTDAADNSVFSNQKAMTASDSRAEKIIPKAKIKPAKALSGQAETVVVEKNKSEPTASVKRPHLVDYQDSEETYNPSDKHVESGNHDFSENTSHEVVKTIIKTKPNSKHRFSYQFYNSQLILHGKYEATYELIEVHDAGMRHFYLKYKGTYYEIKENQEKIVPLTSIQDPIVLDKIKRN